MEVAPQKQDNSPDASPPERKNNASAPDSALRVSWLKIHLQTLKAFLTYVRVQDLWSALYSILFIAAASLVFGRLPKMPLPVLVFLPFVYLSLLGAGLLLLGVARDRFIGEGKYKLTRKLLGPQSGIARYLKRDGSRMLRSAFGVGVYMLAALIYNLVMNSQENELGWLLIPAVLIGMMAIFSLNQQIEKKLQASDSSQISLKQSLRNVLGPRTLYIVVLMACLYALYRLLSQLSG